MENKKKLLDESKELLFKVTGRFEAPDIAMDQKNREFESHGLGQDQQRLGCQRSELAALLSPH